MLLDASVFREKPEASDFYVKSSNFSMLTSELINAIRSQVIVFPYIKSISRTLGCW